MRSKRTSRRAAVSSEFAPPEHPLGLIVDPETSARLGKIRQKNTGPEMAVRKMLTALGIRYRVSNRDLPGSPDIANRKHRWAIFVHGCFWHGHPGCPKATVPKRNRQFWSDKLAANRRRDARVVRALRSTGWRVQTIWACRIVHGNTIALLARLANFVAHST